MEQKLNLKRLTWDDVMTTPLRFTVWDILRDKPVEFSGTPKAVQKYAESLGFTLLRDNSLFGGYFTNKLTQEALMIV